MRGQPSKIDLDRLGPSVKTFKPHEKRLTVKDQDRLAQQERGDTVEEQDEPFVGRFVDGIFPLRRERRQEALKKMQEKVKKIKEKREQQKIEK